MMNLKEYISEKYYILDLFKELVDNLNIDNVDCNELLLSFPIPIESYTGGEVDLVKNAIVNFIKRNSCHYKVDLDLKSQFDILYQINQPNQNSVFYNCLNSFITHDFTNDLDYFKKALQEIVNYIDLGEFHILKLMNREAYFLLCEKEKQELLSLIQDGINSGHLDFSSIPEFIRFEKQLLINISFTMTVGDNYDSYGLYTNSIIMNNYHEDLEFLSSLMDDGGLMLYLAPENIKDTKEFWLIYAQKYDDFPREGFLDQFDYQNYFYSMVPNEIKAQEDFKKKLKNILPRFHIPD